MKFNTDIQIAADIQPINHSEIEQIKANTIDINDKNIKNAQIGYHQDYTGNVENKNILGKTKDKIIQNLINIGLLPNGYNGAGSIGEFDHEKGNRFSKWAVIACIAVIIYLCLKEE